MMLEEAVLLFRRLGVNVQTLSPEEFNAAYYRLALRYHPDISPRTHELMANINAARTVVLKSHPWSTYEDSFANDYRSGQANAWEDSTMRRRTAG